MDPGNDTGVRSGRSTSRRDYGSGRSRRPDRKRRRTGSRSRIPIILVVSALLIITLLAALGRGAPAREGEATIRIDSGTSTAEIARLLKEEDVIESERDFMKQAEKTGVAGNLRAGTYRFQRGEDIAIILAKLEQGLQAPEGVLTVPEGFKIGEIATELAAKTEISEKQYRKAAVPAGRTLPFKTPEGLADLEGFMFPSTYDLDPGVTAEILVDQQLDAFRQQTAALPWNNAESLGVTEFEALIVASMVEREARVPEERALVAAVIYNRISEGMRLEVDATVQYAVGYWKEELTQQDLEIESPYNTRLNSGLPPGPICNPGAESIRAALEPADVDYLFYVATGDEAGHHFFTASYDEFLEAKEGSD